MRISRVLPRFLAPLFLFSSAGAGAAPVADDDRSPNVILIYVDDLGYGDLGCYGSQKNDTPNIDRLAKEGKRFTGYYSASSVCSPSRAALLTGCYPARVGFETFQPSGKAMVLFPGNAEGMHPDEVLLPELLGMAGYATCHIGKWHLGDQPEHLPTRHGFDHYFGIPYSNDMAIMPSRPNQPPLPLLRGEEVIDQQPAQAPLIERYTGEAVNFLRANRTRPFFLYLAHLHVHLPHYVMDRFARASRNGAYGAALAAVDWSTGVLLDELERLELADNTIVIFTSDNGSRADRHGGSNAPWRGKKGETWEGGMRVPCLVRWPRRMAAGSVCHELVTAMDFYPTLAGLAGRDLSGGPVRDGRDVLPLWLDESGATSPHEFFHYYWRGELQAVRSGPWKLRHVVAVGADANAGEPALYHLGKDPGESTDVAAAHPGVVARLNAAMDSMRGELGDRRLGIEGRACRPPARSANPKPLTRFVPGFPYAEPSYLLDEAG